MLNKLLILFSKERLLYLLRNPRANPQETALVFGFFVIGIFILLLVIWLVILPTARRPRRKIGEKVTRPTFREDIVFVLEILFLAAVVVFLSISVTSPFPSACRTCHTMRGSYNSWSKSSHSSVRCTLCHQKPGALGFAIGKAEYVQMVVSYTLGLYQKPIQTTTPNESCLRCHQKVRREVITRGRVEVSHKEFLQVGYECTDCHGQAGHKKTGAFVRLPKMDKCVLCHDGRKVSNECSFCHLPKYAEKPRLSVADFPKVSLVVTNCEGCHPTDKCTACHGIYMPHPPGFRNAKGHARPAFTQRSLCNRCHSPNRCNQCHTQAGTHGEEWVSGHAKAAINPQSCFICGHKSYVTPPSDTIRSLYFCDNCHDTIPQYRPSGPEPESPPED